MPRSNQLSNPMHRQRLLAESNTDLIPRMSQGLQAVGSGGNRTSKGYIDDSANEIMFD